ncbi:MAG: DNA/RNA nuclease SfsA, partial [Oscillospiraceae bacterium]|nr:DNA/RNA nuclease SfsA [Oscillospiraceae bacterium]
MLPIVFPVPLEEGVIIERKNRFDMLVRLAGQTVECHCPTTWNIGQLNVAGRPCLLSQCEKPDPRKTPYT